MVLERFPEDSMFFDPLSTSVLERVRRSPDRLALKEAG
jgi:hypothetical protein